MQELIERGGIDPRHRLVPGDEPLVGEIDRDAQGRLGGALAGARLQHPQLALLDRELEILHVAVVLFQQAVDAGELGEGLRHRPFHGGLFGAGGEARFLGDLLRRADAGHHVLALGVDQELAIETFLAGRRIARERDAGRRGLAQIAEHHGLDVDRGAPAFRDTVQAAIRVGALVHPAPEHRADRAPQLCMRILRERLAKLLGNALLVAGDELGPVVGLEVGVEHVAVLVLVLVENFLEHVMADAQHHVGIHGDEAAVAVIGEASVARLLGQRLDGRVVEPEIEDRVHHPRHRCARARAHRHQQRIFRVAKTLSGELADMGERCLDLGFELFRIGLPVGVEVGAQLRGDAEAGGDRQSEIGHLGQVSALAAEQVAHPGPAFGLAVAEGVNPFCLARRRFSRRRGAGGRGRRPDAFAFHRGGGAPRRLAGSRAAGSGLLGHGAVPVRRYSRHKARPAGRTQPYSWADLGRAGALRRGPVRRRNALRMKGLGLIRRRVRSRPAGVRPARRGRAAVPPWAPRRPSLYAPCDAAAR